jgi:hypothetical protein
VRARGRCGHLAVPASGPPWPRRSLRPFAPLRLLLSRRHTRFDPAAAEELTMSLPTFPSAWMTEEHHALADSVRRFIAERWTPRAAEFRAAGRMGPEVWREAGANGLLCLSTPADYGGGGGDFGHEAVLLLEQSRANCSGWGGGLHSAIVAPYLLHYGSEDAEAALAARHVPRRVDQRDRDDRARHRQRPAGDPHDGQAGPGRRR